MTDLDEMRRLAARDLAAAKARAELIEDMALLMASMRTRGFNPQLTQRHDEEDLLLSITVDLNDLALPGRRLPDPLYPYPSRPMLDRDEDAEPVAELVAVDEGAPDEPAEEVVPEAAEPEPEPHPVAEAPDPKRPWTDSEERLALEFDRQGMNTREIGAELARSWQAVALKLKALKSEPAEPEPAPEEPEPEAEEPEHAEEPVAEQPAASSPSGPMLDLDALTVRERVIERRLQAAGYPQPFTPQSDLALVQALFIGDGLALASERLSIDKAALLARYKMLMPEPSVGDQPAVLSVLRQRVARAD